MKKPITTGIEQIDLERCRQINQEGYRADHDAQHKNGELAAAGGTYALAGTLWGHNLYRAQHRHRDTVLCKGHPDTWPWLPEDWKPTHDNRIKMLAKAGALIAAEIDRLLATPSEEK